VTTSKEDDAQDPDSHQARPLSNKTDPATTKSKPAKPTKKRRIQSDDEDSNFDANAITVSDPLQSVVSPVRPEPPKPKKTKAKVLVKDTQASATASPLTSNQGRVEEVSQAQPSKRRRMDAPTGQKVTKSVDPGTPSHPIPNTNPSKRKSSPPSTMTPETRDDPAPAKSTPSDSVSPAKNTQLSKSQDVDHKLKGMAALLKKVKVYAPLSSVGFRKFSSRSFLSHIAPLHPNRRTPPPLPPPVPKVPSKRKGKEDEDEDEDDEEMEKLREKARGQVPDWDEMSNEDRRRVLKFMKEQAGY